MNKRHRWLLSEIDDWVRDQLVTVEQGRALRARYETATSAVPWGLLVFASAGAIVTGLGIILLLAYNWNEIGKGTKLALIFGSLIAAHTGAGALLRHHDWRAKLGEALAAFATMLFGAGIWLIAQIYHIDEHYPNGFLLWSLGALAMAWAIRSSAVGAMATVLLAVWGGTEGLDYARPTAPALALVVAGIVPLAWRNRTAWLLGLAIVAVLFLLLTGLAYWSNAAPVFVTIFAIAVLLTALARLVSDTGFPDASRVFAFFGSATFLVCAYLLSFPRAARSLLEWSGTHSDAPALAVVTLGAVFAAAGVAWTVLGVRVFARRTLPLVWSDWLLPIALAYAIGIAATDLPGWPSLMMWSFTLVLLGLAANWMLRGCNESRVGVTVLGSAVLACVVLARYLDLFDSLAARGFAFIILGLIFVGEAFYYRKVRRSTEGGET